MRQIEIIPNERDAEALKMYKFMSWFVRKYKNEIKDSASKVLEYMVLYGDGDWEYFFNKHQIASKKEKE